MEAVSDFHNGTHERIRTSGLLLRSLGPEHAG